MISIVIPVRNPDHSFKEVIKILREQTVPGELVIIDSSEKSDLIDEIGLSYDSEKIIKIKPEEFNHGATRNLALSITNSDILIFLTQDALPANEYAVENLIKPFWKDKKIGAAYGRQLPRKNAHPVEAHARLFNYPSFSDMKTLSDRSRLGIKTAFISNSFSAYRREALQEIGGFPSRVILSEDMYAGAKLLLKGWKIAYCADAMVYHSHNYSVWQEFKRYFDIGVFHCRENWILKTFGKAEGEGMRFIASEIRYLLRKNPLLIFFAIFRNIMKFVAYRLGRSENHIPRWLKQRLSMHKDFWKNP